MSEESIHVSNGPVFVIDPGAFSEKAPGSPIFRRQINDFEFQRSSPIKHQNVNIQAISQSETLMRQKPFRSTFDPLSWNKDRQKSALSQSLQDHEPIEEAKSETSRLMMDMAARNQNEPIRLS
jgi:hypothetical protein